MPTLQASFSLPNQADHRVPAQSAAQGASPMFTVHNDHAAHHLAATAKDSTQTREENGSMTANGGMPTHNSRMSSPVGSVDSGERAPKRAHTSSDPLDDGVRTQGTPASADSSRTLLTEMIDIVKRPITAQMPRERHVAGNRTVYMAAAPEAKTEAKAESNAASPTAAAAAVREVTDEDKPDLLAWSLSTMLLHFDQAHANVRGLFESNMDILNEFLELSGRMQHLSERLPALLQMELQHKAQLTAQCAQADDTQPSSPSPPANASDVTDAGEEQDASTHTTLLMQSGVPLGEPAAMASEGGHSFSPAGLLRHNLRTPSPTRPTHPSAAARDYDSRFFGDGAVALSVGGALFHTLPQVPANGTPAALLDTAETPRAPLAASSQIPTQWVASGFSTPAVPPSALVSAVTRERVPARSMTYTHVLSGAAAGNAQMQPMAVSHGERSAAAAGAAGALFNEVSATGACIRGSKGEKN